MTGSNGLPVATSARPSDQAITSAGCASELLVGFDSGSTSGRATWLAISRTTASVKAPGSPVVPISTVGFSARTTASRSRGCPAPRP